MPASLHPDLGLLLLLACCHTPGLVGATVPAAPVNVSVTQLRAHSAMVTWNIPQGDTVIGYSISQQFVPRRFFSLISLIFPSVPVNASASSTLSVSDSIEILS